MNEDRLNELLERCESPIERELLQNLYPHLTTDRARELRAQYKIDRFGDMRLTIPDFAFPDMRIAIYCDGFKWRAGNWYKFRTDRMQSRELQLRGWIVLRFAGSEIHRDGEMVTDTIQRAIARRERQQNWWAERHQDHLVPTPPRIPRRSPPQLVLHSGKQQKPEGGMCGVIVLVCVIVGILVLLDFIF